MHNENEMLKGDKKLPLNVLIKRNLEYVKDEKKTFIIAFTLLIVTVIVDVILPLFLSQATNELKASNIKYFNILILAISYLIISVINQGMIYVECMLLQRAGQKIIYNLRCKVFTHIERMSLDQFSEMPVGSLVTRVANYTASMSDLFTNVLEKILKNALTIIGVYAVMITLSPTLSAFLFIFVVIVFVTSYYFSVIIGKFFRTERRYISELNTFLSENLSGMKITQIFNQEKRKENEFLVKNENLRRERFKIIIAFGIYRPFVYSLYLLSLALTFTLSIQLGLNAGEILAFYLFLSKFFHPIQNLADQINNLQKAFTASERIFNLLDVKPHGQDKEDALEIDHFKGRIEFKNVWFAYTNEDWILKDVSFVIEPGQQCAFVGATGAGKTTILGLIVRNYEIQKGQILIDGIDIKDIKIESLRKAIGQMLQDVFLFSGTIKTNITLHDESFTDEEIIETCKYVNADSFINKLDKGIYEEVIERGENLSQGQRQLLSFARTVLHKPQILILDEATANIDTETEVLIQQSLEKIKNIGTMLVVAHRLSTIQHADQIIVLQKGEIIEKGNHQELLKQRGHYYKLYQLQFENQ